MNSGVRTAWPAVYEQMTPQRVGSKIFKVQSMPCHQQAYHHLCCKLSGVRSGYETKINTDGDDQPCMCIHTTTTYTYTRVQQRSR